jgi:DNA-binding SARP family transcriptional activator/predicted ATPase
MAHLHLSLLGPFRATLDGQPLTGFDSDKVRALLAYLAVESDLAHRRETVAGLLWPDWPERAARRNLNQALANLRRVVGDRNAVRPFLVATRQDVRFDRGSDHWLDVAVLATAVDACAAHCPEGTVLCEPCLKRLAEAVQLYRGDLMEGFSLADSPEFEQWILVQREHARRQMVYALSRLAAGNEYSGDYMEGARYARRWTELEPSEERAHRQLMRLYAWSGQRAAALRQYRKCVRILEHDLGVSPGEETVQLHERIANGELPPQEGLLTETPVPQPSAPRHSLPAQLVPLVGRSRELAEILAQLLDPACRLLTLVGPGGSGKTRLAIEAARQVLALPGASFADGVYFVPLAAVHSPGEMASTVAQAIGLSGSAGVGAREQLLGYLRDREVLLVLDNMEHLLPAGHKQARAGPEIPLAPVPPGTRGGATLVAEVLHAAPAVKVLATSRVRLNVRGEQLYLVPGMDAPPGSAPGGEAGDEAKYSAVQLFLQSTRQVQPALQPTADDMAHIARICRLVGGLPLAILLAAGWMRVLSPAEIAAELSRQEGSGLDLLATDWRGVPERQRSIRAVLDHSYRLLSESHREALQGLSVFRGTFTREAAAEVADAALQDLLVLADASLLQRTANGRYELHELLRQYACEKLGESPQATEAARDRHAAYYAAAMEHWAQEMQTPRALATLNTFRAELPDIRTAWAWMVERGQSSWLGQALDGVHWVFEGLRRIDDAEAMYVAAEHGLASARSSASAPQLRVLSRALAGYGYLLFWERGDQEGAQGRSERSLAVLQRQELSAHDVRRERAFALMVRGMTGGDLTYQQATGLVRRSVALFRGLGDRFWTAYALNRWGTIAGRYGEWEEAKRLHESADALFRELDLDVSRTSALSFLCVAAIYLGEFGQAERLARENLAIRQELSHEDLGMGYVYLGWALYARGRFAKARSALAVGLATCDQLGLTRRRFVAALGWIAAGVALGGYDEAQGQCRAQVQECRRLDQVEIAGCTLALLSWADLAAGSSDEAWQRAQEALALAPEHGPYPFTDSLLARSASGYAARALGRRGRGHSSFRQALGMAAATKRVFHVLHSLPGAALLLADQSQAERAVELYALCCRYPLIANSRWYEDVVGWHIASAAEALPEDVVAAAKERGRTADLWATVHALLAEWGPQEEGE